MGYFWEMVMKEEKKNLTRGSPWTKEDLIYPSKHPQPQGHGNSIGVHFVYV